MVFRDNAGSIRDEVVRCGACRLCLDVCPSYQEKQDERFSPMYRMLVIRKILDGAEPDDLMRRILGDCTLCGECDGICTEEIQITESIRTALRELDKRQA